MQTIKLFVTICIHLLYFALRTLSRAQLIFAALALGLVSNARADGEALTCGKYEAVHAGPSRFYLVTGAALSYPLIASVRLSGDFLLGPNEPYCWTTHRGMLDIGEPRNYVGPDLEAGIRGYRAGLRYYNGAWPINLGGRVVYTDLWSHRDHARGAIGAEVQFTMIACYLSLGVSRWRDGGVFVTATAGFNLEFAAFRHLKMFH